MNDGADRRGVLSRMMAAPIREALRAATAAAHERLHHLAAFAPLVAGTISRDAYRALIARTHGFHAAFEPAIGAALAATRFAPVAAASGRLALLRADLLALGLDAAAITALPTADPPALTSPAHALGSLYVLEGSTLGGRQLSRQLDHLLGPDNHEGRRFLNAGANPGHVAWRDFCAMIESAAAAAADRAGMIATAVETFHGFERWFVAAEKIGNSA